MITIQISSKTNADAEQVRLNLEQQYKTSVSMSDCTANLFKDEPNMVHKYYSFADGLVVSLQERNGYDDSDFVANWYNPETDTVECTEYATTRGWTYLNGARVDATPEIIAKYNQKREESRKAAEQARVDVVGRTVRVNAGKKYFGTIGTVLRVMKDKYHRGSVCQIKSEKETFWINQYSLTTIPTTA
jgi:hypothetical protein